MADIAIDLGTVTVKDHAVGSGKLTQQNFKDWLDEQFDIEGAGGNYAARMRTAVRSIGIRGTQARAGAYTNQKLKAATPVTDSDIIEETA